MIKFKNCIIYYYPYSAVSVHMCDHVILRANQSLEKIEIIFNILIQTVNYIIFYYSIYLYIYIHIYMARGDECALGEDL